MDGDGDRSFPGGWRELDTVPGATGNHAYEGY
jgi:hypothetical protein